MLIVAELFTCVHFI